MGEIASKRLSDKAKKKLVGDEYKKKDGSFKKRGYFKDKTGKNPPRRYIAPKARKIPTPVPSTGRKPGVGSKVKKTIDTKAKISWALPKGAKPKDVEKAFQTNGQSN